MNTKTLPGGPLSGAAGGDDVGRRQPLRRGRRAMALGLAGVLVLAACGSDDDDTSTDADDDGALAAPAEDTEATLRVWLNGPDTPDEMIDLAKDEFAERYPDVTVEVERQE